MCQFLDTCDNVCANFSSRPYRLFILRIQNTVNFEKWGGHVQDSCTIGGHLVGQVLTPCVKPKKKKQQIKVKLKWTDNNLWAPVVYNHCWTRLTCESLLKQLLSDNVNSFWLIVQSACFNAVPWPSLDSLDQMFAF